MGGFARNVLRERLRTLRFDPFETFGYGFMLPYTCHWQCGTIDPDRPSQM
jgi:hypothetical protein